jgi:hypothetical protein
VTNRVALADLHRWANSKNFAANLHAFVGLTNKFAGPPAAS